MALVLIGYLMLFSFMPMISMWMAKDIFVTNDALTFPPPRLGIYWRQYAELYAPFISFTLIRGIAEVSASYTHPFVASNPLRAGGCGYVLALCWSLYHFKKRAHITLYWRLLRFFALLFLSSFFASMWALFIMTCVEAAIQANIIPADADQRWLLGIIAVMIVWHFFSGLMIVYRHYPLAFGLGGFVVLAILWSFPAQLGGIGLRVIGYGGGIPIKMLVRIPDLAADKLTPRLAGGCLYLWVGSQVTVQFPTSEAIELTRCHLNPQTPVKGQRESVWTRVLTINSSDVLTVFHPPATP